jgi:hypothetical protein
MFESFAGTIAVLIYLMGCVLIFPINIILFALRFKLIKYEDWFTFVEKQIYVFTIIAIVLFTCMVI